MPLYRKDLGRGVFYNHIQTDVFKTSSFSVNFVVPHRRETAAVYAVLPMVLHRGCRAYPDRRAISRRLEELYGAALSVRSYKRGELRVINFTVNTIDNTYLPKDEQIDLFKEVLSLLSDLLLDPVLEDGHFLVSYTESEIRNCKDTIRAAINNKTRYAFDRCVELMFEGEHYGVPSDGYIEDYDGITQQDLTAAYRSMLEEARVEVFYGGKESPEKVEPFAQSFFEKVNRKTDGHLPDTVVSSEVKKIRHFDESTPAEQGKLVIGFRTPITANHRDAVTFAVFNEIFGGSASSKLFMNVREKMSLCYSCSSVGDTTKGALIAYAGIDNENKQTTINEILKQLDNIRQNVITDEELHCAKQSLASAYQSLVDSVSSLEVWYLRRILCGYKEEPEDVIERVHTISKDEVAAVSKTVNLDTIYFLKGDKSALYSAADCTEENEDAE
ncbi:MAG: insulinase family protein [Clostridia bacterium]|nr:insulinase family protein [Clostridia bacterium]